MNTRLPVVLVGALLTLLTFSAPAALPWSFLPTPIYTLTDLGLLPGFDSSSGTAINLRGQAVGYCYDSQSGGAHAFVYRQGHLRDLGVLVSPPGYNSQASSINVEGQVGGSSFPVGGTTGLGFLYSPGRGVETFSAPGCLSTTVLSINNFGQCVGYGYVGPGGPGGPITEKRAFVRQPNGAITNLDVFGSTWAEADGINDWGRIVGTFVGLDGANHAFLTQPGGATPKDLGFLPVGYGSEAHAVNDFGQVVGDAGVPDPAALHENLNAFLYDGGKMHDLGALLGIAFTVANGINNWSQVVGGASSFGGGSAGWVYLQGQMYPLTGLLSPAAQGWTVTYASGINDFGQIIGAATFNNGTPHAVILTPSYW